MAKAAILEPSVADNLPFGRRECGVGMKRITPSELRGEQLKRKNCQILANEPLPNRIAGGIADGPKKAESLKVPRYVDTRVDAVYQVKKSSERSRVLYGNEKLKEPCATKGTSVGLADLSANRSLDSLKKNSLLSDKETSGIYDQSTVDTAIHGLQKIEKCSQSVLRHVAEVHLGCEKSDPTKVDMEKALKGLAAREVIRTSVPSSDSLVKSSKISSTPAASLCSRFQIAGHKAPLDFTLKTRLLLVSSSPVKWCHALNAHPAKIGISQYISKLCPTKDQMECASSPNSTAEALYSKALNLWLYPQSSLPASVISALSLSTANGEVDFLSRRRQDWEESFRNLYYMVRKNLCNMFYVYTRHFVILFLGGNLLGQSKQSCNAFISQSTRGLRSLLRKHGLKFSMPLCRAEAEQAAEADLIELSEIEKRNVGQTVQLDSFVGVDNDPQSLLAFMGNQSVHGLYDFLLNHRFLLPSLASDDVPALYSPVPFQNASLCVPEVRCKEMKMANSIFQASNGSDSDDGDSSSVSSVCYSIEIKDTILPPWIISRICSAMNSDGRGYDMSFTTDHNSKSLNAALVCVFAKCNKSAEPNTDVVESGDIFGIPEAIVTPRLYSAFLKHLKYSDGAHSVDISPA